MNVRHTADVRVLVKSGAKVLSDEVVAVRLLDAHLTVQSYCWGGAFGQASWHDGKARTVHPPKVTVNLVNPADELKPGQECDCTECVPV